MRGDERWIEKNDDEIGCYDHNQTILNSVEIGTKVK